jgi:hypothetical protein
MKELFEPKLGSMTIYEYEIKFLELLKYVAFIKDEKFNIHRYLSGFHSFISDNIQYDYPKMLEETKRYAKCLYEKQRGRSSFQKDWEDNMKSKVEQRKKEDKPPFFRNTVQGQKISRSLIISEIMWKESWK